MSEVAVYQGAALTAIDPKGRLAIPASFRNPILKSSHNEKKVILAKNSRLPCLTGYGTSYREELLQIVRNSREQADGGAHNFRSEYVGAAIFTLSDEVSFDASGRLILPPMLRDAAGITGAAIFAHDHT